MGGEANKTTRTRVGAPLVDVDLRKTRNEQLELFLREDLKQVLGDDLVKTLKESLPTEESASVRDRIAQSGRTHPDLVLDLCRKPLIRDQANVLGFVLVRDCNVASVGDEIDDLGNAKVVALDGHSEIQDAVDVVVEHPDERLVILGVNGLEVSMVDGLPEHVLVDS